jgi:hypothetical protein
VGGTVPAAQNLKTTSSSLPRKRKSMLILLAIKEQNGFPLSQE